MKILCSVNGVLQLRHPCMVYYPASRDIAVIPGISVTPHIRTRNEGRETSRMHRARAHGTRSEPCGPFIGMMNSLTWATVRKWLDKCFTSLLARPVKLVHKNVYIAHSCEVSCKYFSISSVSCQEYSAFDPSKRIPKVPNSTGPQMFVSKFLDIYRGYQVRSFTQQVILNLDPRSCCG